MPGRDTDLENYTLNYEELTNSEFVASQEEVKRVLERGEVVHTQDKRLAGLYDSRLLLRV